jgi:hypothetical protein
MKLRFRYVIQSIKLTLIDVGRGRKGPTFFERLIIKKIVHNTNARTDSALRAMIDSALISWGEGESGISRVVT